MTRARKKLYLLFAKNRTVFGTTHFRVMSRFIEEIPQDYLELKKADYFSRRKHYVERPGLPPRASQFEDDFNQTYGSDNVDDSFGDSDTPKTGSRVTHPIFGQGIVRQLLGADKVMVEFPGRGVKKISLKFTQLKTD